MKFPYTRAPHTPHPSPMPDAQCPMPDAQCPMPDAQCPNPPWATILEFVV
ncbi:MAG: hypothetical protein F6J93_15090 [Oscillatoria sp. SIO1A7]|nr:hypothetical protein [Oscillatoria sp. SIO1A7]